MARRQAYVVGAFEHPTREAKDKSSAQLHAEVSAGALADAGLRLEDVDAYFTAKAPGLGPVSMVEYLGLRPRYVGSTDIGGSSYIMHVHRAAQAIAQGLCDVALISLAGRPRSEGLRMVRPDFDGPENDFERPYRPIVPNVYGLAAMRHMHEFGTTRDQLSWVRVAASEHAQHNANAVYRDPVSVQDVSESPLISEPLRRLDSCVITDGGGALIVAAEEVARTLDRPMVRVAGGGAAIKHLNGGRLDMTYSAAVWSGAAAFEEAGVRPTDIKYASIYDSFTITELIAIEDLGFCEKGKGGQFVSDGNVISGVGTLPVNTDGGGLCNNHPGNRGGMTKVIEAVRQLRGEAHPAVQVPDCDLALAHGTGGWVSTRHGSATVILERQ